MIHTIDVGVAELGAEPAQPDEPAEDATQVDAQTRQPVDEGPAGDDGPTGDDGRAGDDGMATAEYAVATLAACAFAGLLLVIVRSDEVRQLLFGIIQRALSLS